MYFGLSTQLLLLFFFINEMGFFSGGSTLYIESTKLPSIEKPDATGGVEVTGHLGDVMKESVKIALSVAKNYLAKIDPKNDFLIKNHIHVHFPEVAKSFILPKKKFCLPTRLIVTRNVISYALFRELLRKTDLVPDAPSSALYCRWPETFRRARTSL